MTFDGLCTQKLIGHLDIGKLIVVDKIVDP